MKAKSSDGFTIPPISEKKFQQQVLQIAKLHRWATYHTFDSRRSNAGFPDLVLVRAHRLIFAELKSEKGKESIAQESWRQILKQTTAEAYLWRPSMMDEIIRILT